MSPFLSTLGSGSAKGLGRALRPFIRKPSITSPANNATNQSSTSLSFSSSAIQIVGKGTAHASSDWQIASNSNFSTIVLSLTNSTSNKTSWTVTSGLSLNTTYYARVRYKDTTNLISDWSSTITFTLEGYLPSLSNGSTDLTVSAGLSTNWTVPTRIGRIRVQMYGSSSGPGGGQPGYMDVSLDVVPGEQITFARTASRTHTNHNNVSNAPAVAFWGYNGSSTITQASLWAIVGGSGGIGRHMHSNFSMGASPGGGDTAPNGTTELIGSDLPTYSTGGSQSAGGSEIPAPLIASYGWNQGGPESPTMPTNGLGTNGYELHGPGQFRNSTPRPPKRGTAIYGGGEIINGTMSGDGRDDAFSDGGDGWYGGAGGATIYGSRFAGYNPRPDDFPHAQTANFASVQVRVGATGGSSRIQIPSGRNPTTITNQSGTAGGPNLPTGVKIIF